MHLEDETANPGAFQVTWGSEDGPVDTARSCLLRGLQYVCARVPATSIELSNRYIRTTAGRFSSSKQKGHIPAVARTPPYISGSDQIGNSIEYRPVVSWKVAVLNRLLLSLVAKLSDYH